MLVFIGSFDIFTASAFLLWNWHDLIFIDIVDVNFDADITDMWNVQQS